MPGKKSFWRSSATGIVLALSALTVSLLSFNSVQASTAVTRICQQYWHLPVDGGRYVYRNDDSKDRGECLTNYGGTANFTVTKSGARGRHPLVQAYPYIFTGWSWGIGTAGTPLPARIRRIHPVVSMDTKDHAKGRWNSSLDMWISSKPLHNGQAEGAELMIWENSRANDHWSPSQIVRIDGADWYFKNWTTRHNNGESWPLIIYWRVHPTWHLDNLRIRPFINHAGALIKHRWYLLNIEAGFEIWENGQGLSVKNFSADMHYRPRPKKCVSGHRKADRRRCRPRH
ncbi:MAG: hypothetical protein ABSA03_09210 [Streptosporangiaceae bacterium]|jgi:hypothetical protein